MKGATKELISMTVILVLAFLVLTHFTGFAKDVGALGQNYAAAVKVLQGRG